jgi:peptidoglycan/LPS O-acetylase OafA/YrhL
VLVADYAEADTGTIGIPATAITRVKAPAAFDFNPAAHGLRGVASILVLVAHILGGTARHIYPGRAAYVHLIKHPWYFGTFGVEIFFVISGFVILPSALKYSAGEFALRRFVRIYPLFFTLSILFVSLNFVTNRYADINTPGSIIAGLLFVNLFTGTDQLTPNAWSLSFEVAFYVLTVLVVTFAYKQRRMFAGALAIGLAAAFLFFCPITVYFLIGIAMRVLVSNVRKANFATRAVEMLALLALIGSASRGHYDYTSWAQFSGVVVPSILVSISVYFYLALMPRSFTALALSGRVFRYAGDVSYSLYLVHPFVYFVLRALFVRYGWFTDNIAASILLFGVAVFAVSFLLTHYVHRALERWPYRRIFHQKVYHAQNAPVLQASSC